MPLLHLRRCLLHFAVVVALRFSALTNLLECTKLVSCAICAAAAQFEFSSNVIQRLKSSN